MKIRVLNKLNKEVKSPDLNQGYLIEEQIIRVGVKPIDNKRKFAYTDEDWETIHRYVEYADLPKVEYTDPFEQIQAMREDINTLLANQLMLDEEDEDNE